MQVHPLQREQPPNENTSFANVATQRERDSAKRTTYTSYDRLFLIQATPFSIPKYGPIFRAPSCETLDSKRTDRRCPWACANSHIDDALQHVSAATRNWRRGAARRCPRAIPIATAQRGQRRARRTVSSADSRTAPRASRTRSRRRDVLKTRPYFQGRKMATFLGPPCGPNSEARKRSRFGCRKTAPVNTT
jgi:hypothetical protein